MSRRTIIMDGSPKIMVERHLDWSNRIPTPFLSFGTWEKVSSVIYTLTKKMRIQNIRVYFLLTDSLPATIPIYRVYGIAKELEIDLKPYMEGEYLVCGTIPNSSYLVRTWGDGTRYPLDLPMTRPHFLPFANDVKIHLRLPTGMLAYFDNSKPASLHLECLRRLMPNTPDNEVSEFFRCILVDALTRGEIFTVGEMRNALHCDLSSIRNPKSESSSARGAQHDFG
jgi:hypothetical protein